MLCYFYYEVKFKDTYFGKKCTFVLTKYFWHGFVGRIGGIELDILIIGRSDDKRRCRYRFPVSFRNIVTLTNFRLLQDRHLRHSVDGASWLEGFLTDCDHIAGDLCWIAIKLARNAPHHIGRRVRRRIGAFGLCFALGRAAVKKAGR